MGAWGHYDIECEYGIIMVLSGRMGSLWYSVGDNGRCGIECKNTTCACEGVTLYASFRSPGLAGFSLKQPIFNVKILNT